MPHLTRHPDELVIAHAPEYVEVERISLLRWWVAVGEITNEGKTFLDYCDHRRMTRH